MEENKVLNADKLANQAYKYSLGNIFIIVFGFISGIPLIIVFSLAICASVFNKANKAKTLGSVLNKKIKTAKIISGIILVIGLMLSIVMFLS